MERTGTQTRQNGNSAPPITSARAEPGKAVTTLKQAVEEFQTGLVARREEYAPALPSHISPERFQRVAVTAVNLNPALLKADRRSLYNACAKAASDGLLPDGRDGALVIFNTKTKDPETSREVYKDVVTWMPMVAGIIKKARQSGEITALGARIVYQKEIEQGKFTHRVVDGVPKVDHEPILWGERGKPVLVYSFVQFKSGDVDFEFLHADDVAKIRAVSRSKDKGPWASWTDEMWKKSAIRRHAKRLPISSELFDTIARDDELTEFEKQRGEAENKMLATARAQLGAAPSLIDGESEVVEAEDAGEGVQADEAARQAVDEGWVD
jgi:recombination protein RecT